MKKKQYRYETQVVNKNGSSEVRVDFLKPNIGLGNASDLYLQLQKSGRYTHVSYPELKEVQTYFETEKK